MQIKKLRFKEHIFTMVSDTTVYEESLHKLVSDFIYKHILNDDNNVKKVDVKLTINKDNTIEFIIYIEYYNKITLINKKLIEDLKPYKLASKIIKKYKKNNIFLK